MKTIFVLTVFLLGACRATRNENVLQAAGVVNLGIDSPINWRAESTSFSRPQTAPDCRDKIDERENPQFAQVEVAEGIVARIVDYNKNYFGDKTRESLLCVTIDDGNPVDFNQYLQAQTNRAYVGKNSYFDGKSRLLIIGTRAFHQDAVDPAQVAATISHELAHYVLDHENLWSATNDPKVIALRSQLEKLYSQYSVLSKEMLKAYKWLENNPHVDVLPEKEAKTLEAYKNFSADGLVSIENNVKVLKEIAQARYEAKWLSYFRTYKVLIEAEADELGLEMYVNAGFNANEYLEAMQTAFFFERRDFLACENKLAEGKVPDVIDSSAIMAFVSHPTPCWRYWRLQKLIPYFTERG